MAVENNSDNRRIEELNRAAYDRKLQNEKQSERARRAQSFQQVMTEKAGRRAAQDQAQRQEATDRGQAADAKRALQQARRRPAKAKRPIDPRLAALARGQLGKKGKARAAEHLATSAAETERAEASLGNERQRVSQTEEHTRRQDEQETIRRDEKQAELVRQDTAVVGYAQDERGGDRGRRQGGQGEGQTPERGAPEVQAAAAPRRARPTIPPEVLKRLVHTIYQAAKADGRTSLQLTLKGGMMDGVRLEVEAEDGQVRCRFGGCDPQLSRLLNDGQPALAAALARKGLKLTALETA